MLSISEALAISRVLPSLYDLKKPDYTCMIYFSENKKKLEKEAVKVKAKYKKSTMVLQAITSDKFSFKKPEE